MFDAERKFLAPLLQRDSELIGWLGVGAIGGLFAPVFFGAVLPTPIKTMLLGTSASCSCAISAIAGSAASQKGSRLNRIIDATDEKLLTESMAHQLAMAQVTGAIGQKQALVEWIVNNVPVEQQGAAFAFVGLQQFAPYQVAAAAEVANEGAIAPRNLHEFHLDEWREESGLGEMSTEAKYALCQGKSMIFAGNPREGKTVAAHYALYQWAKSDPDLVVYANDMHLGMNNDPKFASNWIGIPRVDEIPKDVRTCVVKSTPRMLERFLKPVRDLLQYRKQHNVNNPHVVVAIDEFTNQLDALDEKEVESIVKTFAEIATEAPKYGINFWLILHSLTKDDLGGLSRKVLRAAHVVMGAEMTQDRIQVSNCPRSLPQDSVDFAQSLYRQVGLPAGFATSLPIPDGYLPPPPLENGLQDLILDWRPVAVPTQVSEVVEQRSEPEPKSEPKIKARDLNQKDQVRSAFDAFKAWYSPDKTDAEVVAKALELTGQEVKDVAKLRSLMEGSR